MAEYRDKAHEVPFEGLDSCTKAKNVFNKVGLAMRAENLFYSFEHVNIIGEYVREATKAQKALTKAISSICENSDLQSENIKPIMP